MRMLSCYLSVALALAVGAGCADNDAPNWDKAHATAERALMEREAQLFNHDDYKRAVKSLRQSIDALRQEMCQVNTGLIDRALVEQRAHRRLVQQSGRARLLVDAPVVGGPSAQSRTMLELLAPRMVGLRFVSLHADAKTFKMEVATETCPPPALAPPPMAAPEAPSALSALMASSREQEARALSRRAAEVDAKLHVPLAAFRALVEAEQALEVMANDAPRVGALAPLLTAAFVALADATSLDATLAGHAVTLEVGGLSARHVERMTNLGWRLSLPGLDDGMLRFVADLSRPPEQAGE